jgi:hypothetical protein
MEVNPGTLYRVEITEYEAGWGQRVDRADTKYFTTLEEARAYKAHWETGGSRECYWRAEITTISN